MKHSIRFKITFTLTLMVVLIIGITWIINNAFLSDFYIATKTKTLVQAYNEIVDIYQKSTSTGYLSDADTEKMERLAIKYDVDVNVINNKYAIIYPAIENYGKREANFLTQRMIGYILPGSNPLMENVEQLKKTDNYDIYSLYDRLMDSNYLDLIGYFNNPVENLISYNNAINGDVTNGNSNNATTNNSGATSDDQTGNKTDQSQNNSNSNQSDNSSDNSSGSTKNNQDGNTADGSTDNSLANIDKSHVDTAIMLRTNLESIEESVAIANKFLAYIGIIVIIIGSIAMFLISKKFTKPIQDLSGIAKKMTDLDFDVKYKVNSKDEIGELGKSINSLSDRLESTITELKQANNELTTDIQKKIEIDEMRKEFLSNVSHELKTPICLIQGYAEGLKENINEDEESRNFYCEVIMDEANKMNQMVKKLLSLNELEFGNNQVNFERFNITSLIQSVLNETEILFKQKEVTLHFEQADPIYVWADEYLIEQVLTNYISNALNHVEGQKIIEIKLIQREDNVRIAVFNTGENIPEVDIDRLWVKFYKVDKARTREYGGSGIGLSIVKAIMNSHNKECGVINRPIGVEFWFELDAKL